MGSGIERSFDFPQCSQVPELQVIEPVGCGAPGREELRWECTSGLSSGARDPLLPLLSGGPTITHLEP